MAVSEQEWEAVESWIEGKFKEGTAEELEARRIIARALRHGPLTLGLRVALATLIEPEMRDFYGWWLVSKRAPGAQKTMDRLRVAKIIWLEREAGKPMKAAVSLAMEKCGVRSRDKALAAYKEHKPWLDKMDGKLKALDQID